MEREQTDFAAEEGGDAALEGRSEAGADLSPTVEEALVRALAEASAAGRWDVVIQLARELEARRLAGSNVVALDGQRRRLP